MHSIARSTASIPHLTQSHPRAPRMTRHRRGQLGHRSRPTGRASHEVDPPGDERTLRGVHNIYVASSISVGRPFDPAPDSVRHVATTRDHVRRVLEIRKRAIQGDELATKRQHAKGKLTARQRLEHLLDSGSFTELDLFRRRATGPGT